MITQLDELLKSCEKTIKDTSSKERQFLTILTEVAGEKMQLLNLEESAMEETYLI